MKHFIIGTATLLATLVPAFPAKAQWVQACTMDPYSSVNLRTGPGKNYSIVASVPNGSYVRPLSWVWGNDGMRWYRVESSGLVGFSRQDYLCR